MCTLNMIKVRHYDTISVLEAVEALIRHRRKRYSQLQVNQRNRLYKDHEKKRIIKIFSKPLKVTHSNFLISLLQQQDFVKNFCPHLVSLIIVGDNSQELLLAGYVMQEGNVLNTKDLVTYLRKPSVRNKWVTGMDKHGFYYNDFKAKNLIREAGRIGLIDLEAIHPRPATPYTLSQPQHIHNVSRKIELYDLGWYYDAVGISLPKHKMVEK